MGLRYCASFNAANRDSAKIINDTSLRRLRWGRQDDCEVQLKASMVGLSKYVRFERASFDKLGMTWGAQDEGALTWVGKLTMMRKRKGPGTRGGCTSGPAFV